MSATTIDGVVQAVANSQTRNLFKMSTTTAAGVLTSLWGIDGTPSLGSMNPGNTANGVVPTSSTPGAIPFTNPTPPAVSYLNIFDLDASSAAGAFVLYDRLFQAGKFVAASMVGANVLSSVPSYAARVPTDFSETEIFLEIATAFSATATTVTVEYTNQAGVTGKVATLSVTNLASAIVNRMIPFVLASGDSGVQAITKVTIGGTTATAGEFNILVIRRLKSRTASAAGMGGQILPSDPLTNGMRRVYDNSCLALMVTSATTTTGLSLFTLQIGQA